MMFTVVWHKQALGELANAWLATVEKQQLSDSVNRVDATLRLNPKVKGVDFYGDRLSVVAPLSIATHSPGIRPGGAGPFANHCRGAITIFSGSAPSQAAHQL